MASASEGPCSGLAELQRGRPNEGFSVIHSPDEFGRGCADEDWIPQIAAKHGVIITQDINIYRVDAQWDLCKNNKLGVFFFKPPAGWGYWMIVNEIVRRWAEIKNLSAASRPFGFLIEHNRKKFKKL